ncbi:MAG TPA: hypothetical protein VNP92_09480 [Actinophytocola sp.]|nr:hypothetical protein [Actinophytocola sp.]
MPDSEWLLTYTGADPDEEGTREALLDWDAYRTRYGDIGRLDLILEAENDTTNRYQASKQADVLMLFYLLSAEELTAVLRRGGCCATRSTPTWPTPRAAPPAKGSTSVPWPTSSAEADPPISCSAAQPLLNSVRTTTPAAASSAAAAASASHRRPSSITAS